VLACSQLHEMMHIARELCGGQICVTPDAAAFRDPETGPWLEKFYSVNENWPAEDRRRVVCAARAVSFGREGGQRSSKRDAIAISHGAVGKEHLRRRAALKIASKQKVHLARPRNIMITVFPLEFST
jgi:aromatic ring hydroxylase